MNRELPLIMGQLAVSAEACWEGRDFETPDLVAPLGSGPYRVRFLRGRAARHL